MGWFFPARVLTCANLGEILSLEMCSGSQVRTVNLVFLLILGAEGIPILRRLLASTLSYAWRLLQVTPGTPPGHLV